MRNHRAKLVWIFAFLDARGCDIGGRAGKVTKFRTGHSVGRM